MNFNINNYILVKLTQDGLDEMKKQHNELKKCVPSIGEFKEPAKDENGYTRFQGWCLMHTFGHMMFCGANPPFDINVIIEEKSK